MKSMCSKNMYSQNSYSRWDRRPRGNRRRSCGKGFSLLEILVTIVIFSLGVMALAATQVLNITGTGFNKDAGIATSLAQKRLEDLKNTAFSSIVANTTGVTERGMNVSWDVTTSGTAPHRYKDVFVTVAWAGRSITCYTIITEP
jgi:prepilin-type N-terminal cleavage/methylation domain-containing protein